MSLQFKREHRYFVFKVKNLTQEQQQRLFDFEMELGPRNSVGECVVVESDWPNYQETWDSIRDVSFGTFKTREALIAELKAHHDQLLTELFNWRKKSSSQAVQIETLAKEVDAANDRNAELVEERDALASKNHQLLTTLSDIQQQCIGAIAMSYPMSPEHIGQQIYQATGMTEPELRATVRQGGAV